MINAAASCPSDDVHRRHCIAGNDDEQTIMLDGASTAARFGVATTATPAQVSSASSLLADKLHGYSSSESLVLYFATTGVAVFLAYRLMLAYAAGRRQARSRQDDVAKDQQQQLLERKKDFLARIGNDYGYRDSPCGYIDDWRAREFPGLIAPASVVCPSDAVDHDHKQQDKQQQQEEETDEREVYLDYAGAALPSRSQLEAILRSSLDHVLANPHSTGPAASRTTRQLEQARKRVLDHFHGHGGPCFEAVGGSTESRATNESSSFKAMHQSGYQVLFTSGATEALRIVAEQFPWSKTKCTDCWCRDGDCDCRYNGNDGIAATCPCQRRRRSLFIYPQNAHTSVIGMRGPALAQGASFVCLRPGQCYVKTLKKCIQQMDAASCPTCRDVSVRHLVVLTPECNFGGDRLASVDAIVKSLRALQKPHHAITILADISKAASTGPIDLGTLDVDLACMSFYKMFGEPTGVGCLFIKQSSVIPLFGRDGAADGKSEPRGQVRRYFGGGSIDIALPADDFAVVRKDPSPLAALANGTSNFRGIASLIHGFDALDRFGGMGHIQRHATCLAKEFVRRLQGLRHESGRRVVEIYGDWCEYHFAGASQHAPSPTVAFNLLRDDGSFVGYNEMTKLAALNRPPIQLRSGCFCNPGACQKALKLSSADLRRNFEEAGHVCGDQVDIIDGRPTGALRVSFGKDSIWEDLDAFVSFVEQRFVRRIVCIENRAWDGRPRQVVLSELYVFPIKSCAAQRVKRWQVVFGGRLAYDREFSLVDSSGAAMRLQLYPQMAFIAPVLDIESMTMRVSAPGCSDLVIDLTDDATHGVHGEESDIKVCGNKCGGRVWGGSKVSNWFSDYLGVRCWLARFDRERVPLSNETKSSGRYIRSSGVAFANEQPLLLVSEHAVDQLNLVLDAQHERLVTSRHFRPNFVTRLVPLSNYEIDLHSHDFWTRLSLPDKELVFETAGQCARCSMVDIDPTSGMKGHTLRAMAEHHRRKGQITFGTFLRVKEFDKTMGRSHRWIDEGDIMLCE